MLMMAYERSESAWTIFANSSTNSNLEPKALIRKLERILIKLYQQNVSLLFNQTYLNERLLPNYAHTHTYIYIYIVLFGPVKPELGVIPSGQENHSKPEHLNFPGKELKTDLFYS